MSKLAAAEGVKRESCGVKDGILRLMDGGAGWDDVLFFYGIEGGRE